ncbi:hypothetical protein LCGC14_3085820, partial [marine sediment metagenome]
SKRGHNEDFEGPIDTVVLLYAHPADAPRPDKASQGSTDLGGERPEQVEDAPGGPWTVATLMDKLIQGGVLCSYKMGTEEWYRWVARYAWDRLKGDKT